MPNHIYVKKKKVSNAMFSDCNHTDMTSKNQILCLIKKQPLFLIPIFFTGTMAMIHKQIGPNFIVTIKSK